MAQSDSNPARHLAWPDCYNVRDLGGYAAAGGPIRWRSLVRADNLCRLTPDGCRALIDYGIRTLIDLRSPSELADAPHPFARPAAGAPSYLNLPLLDERDSQGMADHAAARSMLEIYRLYLDRFSTNVAACLRAVADAPPGGVLIHCHAGKDRTGVMIALLLSVAGVSRQDIAADYAASDRFLQTLYAEALARAEQAGDGGQPRSLRDHMPAGSLEAPPDTMLAMLDYLDARHGGVEAYLRTAGVDDRRLERIRHRLAGD